MTDAASVAGIAPRLAAAAAVAAVLAAVAKIAAAAAVGVPAASGVEEHCLQAAHSAQAVAADVLTVSIAADAVDPCCAAAVVAAVAAVAAGADFDSAPGCPILLEGDDHPAAVAAIHHSACQLLHVTDRLQTFGRHCDLQQLLLCCPTDQ